MALSVRRIIKQMTSGRRACGFVIFRRLCGNLEYLLMQTSYGEHHWTPPKGHVDPGEDDMQTALRETEEESGYLKDDLRIHENARREMVYLVGSKPKTVVYWLAELINESKQVQMSKEHQDYKWLSIDEACRLSGYTDMQDALKYFHKHIEENNL